MRIMCDRGGQCAQNGQTAPKGGAQAAVGAEKGGLCWLRTHAKGYMAAVRGTFSTACYNLAHQPAYAATMAELDAFMPPLPSS